MLLSADTISKSFGGVKAVSRVSLESGEREIRGIIGPNGAGKTTVFNLLTGVYPMDEGRVLFQGKDITRYKPHQIIWCGITRTFQNIRLFTSLTVLDNLKVAYSWKTRYGVAGGMFFRCKDWVFEDSEWGFIDMGGGAALRGLRTASRVSRNSPALVENQESQTNSGCSFCKTPNP